MVEQHLNIGLAVFCGTASEGSHPDIAQKSGQHIGPIEPRQWKSKNL